MMKLSLCLLVILPWLGSVAGQPWVGLLFPHLAGNGDTVSTLDCDDCSQKIDIAGNYKFFGTDYDDNVWIGANGYVTMDAGQWRFTPPTSAFNYPDGGSAMVGAYFSDGYLPAHVHLNKIWYRETTDQTMLEEASDIINSYFPTCNCGGAFSATHAIIVTWRFMPSYCEIKNYFVGCPSYPGHDWHGIGVGKRDTSDEKRDAAPKPSGNVTGYAHDDEDQNSFQVVIVTNGCDTFVLNNIHTIEWECCFANNQMLFNAGDGTGFWKHPTPWSDEISKASGNSNVGTPGRWAYKVSEKQILDSNCNPIGTGV